MTLKEIYDLGAYMFYANYKEEYIKDSSYIKEKYPKKKRAQEYYYRGYLDAKSGKVKDEFVSIRKYIPDDCWD